MATTTPNFGWAVPTSTDLVKDGAVAIETLGDSIDASLVDLKGGTTGQVLAKASNTDMDFTWSAGASVPTSLGFTAGKNKIINGDFGIWQRGTSFAAISNASFAADRYQVVFDGTGVRTVSRQTFTPGAAPVAGYEGSYFLRYDQTTAGTGAAYGGFQQNIENVQTLAGQTATLSFWAKADSSRTISYQLTQSFGSGGSGNVNAGTGSQALTTSWTRYSFTISIPSISGKTIGTSSLLQLYFGMPINTLNTIDIWGVQLEAGSVATAFQTATGTLQGELAACQRYYNRYTAPQAYSHLAQGWAISTDNMTAWFYLPVEMRTVPTAIDYASVNMGDGVNAQITPSTITFTADNNNTKAIACTGTKSAGGMTQYRGYQFLAAGDTAAYIGFSAEL
jgi:hypothetical protein